MVVVVTKELVPVAMAQVVLASTNFTAFTDAAGSAVFERLEPGPYTVLAAKPGYQSPHAKGRVVDVLAGQSVEVRLQLDPEAIVSKGSLYHSTFPFTGFIACSVQVNPTAAQNPCGRQTVAPDANGGSMHEWTTDSLLVQTVVMEAAWSPNVGALPFELNFVAYRFKVCPNAATCAPDDAMFGVHGPSPLYGVVREDPTNNLTKRLGSDPTTYPRRHYAETSVWCPNGACPASIVVQQKYEAWVTLFYGEQAPAGWSVRSSS